MLLNELLVLDRLLKNLELLVVPLLLYTILLLNRHLNLLLWLAMLLVQWVKLLSKQLNHEHELLQVVLELRLDHM